MSTNLEKSNETLSLLQSSRSKDEVSQHSINEVNDNALPATSFLQVAIAYTLAFISTVGMCFSVASVQVLGGSIPEFELNVWRFGCQILSAAPFIIYQKGKLGVPKKSWLIMMVAMLCYVSFNTTYYMAAIYLPVGTLAGLTNTVIIILNALCSIIWKEERRVHLYVSAIVASIGIILLVQPEGMFKSLPRLPPTNWTSPCHERNGTLLFEEHESQDMLWLGYILMFLSGLVTVVVFRCIAELVKYVNPYAVTFWAGIFGTVVSLIVMSIVEKPVLPNSSLCWGLLLTHAIGNAVYSVFLPICMQYIHPTVFSFIRSLQLVLLLVLQYTALKEILPGLGNWVEIFASVLCFIGCTIGPLWQLVEEKKKYASKYKK